MSNDQLDDDMKNTRMIFELLEMKWGEPVKNNSQYHNQLTINWSSIRKSIRHESDGWGFESPSGRDIFCLKNFDTFTITHVRLSKMNAVARAQLTFQMLTLLWKYLYCQSQHGTANIWPCYLNMLEHSAWIRRLGVRVPLRLRHFLSTLTLSQEHLFVCRKWMLLPAHS